MSRVLIHQNLVATNKQLAGFIGNPTLNKMQKEGEKNTSRTFNIHVAHQSLCFLSGALREVLKAQKYSNLTVNLFGENRCRVERLYF